MEALLQTLLGGLLALAGTFAAPYFQRKHERWLANRDDQRLLRDKAQELFDELDRFVSESQAAALSALVRMEDKTAETRAVPDLGRVRSIAAIYFPTSLPLIDVFETLHHSLIELMMDEAKKAVDGGTSGLDTLRSLPMIVTVQSQQSASDFVKQMRNHLAKNVPQMELGN